MTSTLSALRTGELQELMDILAPDVVLIADGGGRAAASRVPIHGAARVARLLSRAHRAVPTLQTRIVWLNGSPAGRVEFDGELAAAVSVVVEAGRITRIYVTANPDKLGRLDEPAQLER